MMKNKTNQHLHIDLYNGTSKWISESIFMNYTVGTNFDGHDSKGYYMTYKLDDGTVDKEYYNWRENWSRIKRCETHTVYMGEECMLIDFSNKKLRGNK